MRTRRFANVEKLRSKERRLLEVLRRQEEQRVLDLFPLGLAPNTPLNYSASVGGSTVAVYAPLQALVHVGEQTFIVDQSSTPDPTGGFADVVIEAGKQVGELKTDQTLSMAGKGAGTYLVYTTHNLADEQAETRYPPGKYAEGEGVFTEHAGFYGHGQATGTAIPRNNYDGSLSSQTVSEMVDRLVISVATEASVPSTATKLLKLQWDGSQITSVSNISETVDIDELRTQVTTLEGDMTAAEGDITNLQGRVTTTETDINSVEADLASHIGSRGSAHGNATTSVSGFMSSFDKSKVDGVQSGAQVNPSGSEIFNEVLARDGDQSTLDADSIDGVHADEIYKHAALTFDDIPFTWPSIAAGDTWSPGPGIYIVEPQGTWDLIFNPGDGGAYRTIASWPGGVLVSPGNAGVQLVNRNGVSAEVIYRRFS